MNYLNRSTLVALCPHGSHDANQVKEQMKLLKHLYQAVSNAPAEEEVPELPSDLTAEKMVTVVNAFFSVSNTVIREVVEELISQVPRRGCT